MSDREYDLTFVDPDLRAEVLKRIRIIEEFQKNPGRRNAEQAARQLGIDNPRFYRLARIWRQTKNPQLITSGKRNRIKKSRIPAPIQQIMRDVEAAHPTASAGVIERAMAPLVAALGLKMPARSTIIPFIEGIRRERNAGKPAGEGIAIDFCTVALPVETSLSTTLPIVALVIDLEHSTVIGCALALEATDALAAQAMLDAIGTEPGSELPNGDVRTRIHAGALSEEFLSLLPDMGLRLAADPRNSGFTARRVLGPKLAGFRIVTRRVPDPAAAVRAARRKSTSLIEAQDVICGRLHSGTRRTSPIASLSALDRARLREHMVRTLAIG